MPQETTNVMTTYEIIATVIAILALLQPWIIKLWDRFGGADEKLDKAEAARRK